MFTASRAVGHTSTSSAELPRVPALSALYDSGVKLRRGQLIMVAGMPKVGKSLFATWLANEMNLPTLYFSADSSPHTASSRLAACITGQPITSVETGLAAGASGYYSDAMDDSNISWCFDSSPSTEDLMLELDAYVEAWDVYPEVIVVDNLMNVQASEEYAGQLFVMGELHSLARATGATVFVLHHCSEAGQRDTTIPPPRSAIQGKVSQLPELIVTVAIDPYSKQFRVAVVGNRSGPQFPDGKKFITLDSAVERCSFSHHTPAVYGGGYSYQEAEA